MTLFYFNYCTVRYQVLATHLLRHVYAFLLYCKLLCLIKLLLPLAPSWFPFSYFAMESSCYCSQQSRPYHIIRFLFICSASDIFVFFKLLNIVVSFTYRPTVHYWCARSPTIILKFRTQHHISKALMLWHIAF